jgi:trehalose 6-phosphate synthase
LAEVAPDEAVVWIHDYHLQLVPQMLRDKRPDLLSSILSEISWIPGDRSSALKSFSTSAKVLAAVVLLFLQLLMTTIQARKKGSIILVNLIMLLVFGCL